MKNILSKLLLTMVLILHPLSASASKIPPSVLNELKKDFPGINVRFDGFIELADKTQYLPVYPLNLIKSDAPVKVKQTIPVNLKLKDKPDMILFDNNFALLKVIKSNTARPTVLDSEKMPLIVKLGILPQDLLVPENLVMPESLRIILGDLVIPIKEQSDEFKTFNDFDEFFNLNKKPTTIKNVSNKKLVSIFEKDAPEVKEKAFYAINFETNSVHIVNPETGRDLYQIPVKSVPTDFIQTREQRYLLVTTVASNNAYIIDLLKNEVIKELKVGNYPSAIAVDFIKNIAYISNQNSSSVSQIDLTNMSELSSFDVPGNPSKLILSYDNKQLLYADAISGKIYTQSTDGDPKKNFLLTQVSNLSKFAEANNYLYYISRSDNNLYVFDIKEKKLVKAIPVGYKPVDLVLFGSKAYVLSAESDTLSIVDLNTFEKTKEIPLNSGGFPKRFTILPSTTRAFITSANVPEYILFDLEKDSVIKKYPININLNKVIISNKFK